MQSNLFRISTVLLFFLTTPVYSQGLTLSEILMDPVCSNDDCEFVELKNQTAATIDISSWKVTDGESGINEWTVTFPSGTTLSAWEYIIVTKNLSAFSAEFPGAACTIFQITNVGSGAGLANSGDNVNLLNASGSLIQTYVWSDGNVDRAVYNGSTWTTTTGGNDGDPCANSVLPIILVEFKATYNNSVLLTWRTATETSNDFFSIERSADGRNFTETGRMPGSGTTAEPQDYRFTDDSPLPGLNYYRLRQVDFDGQFSYSKVVSVRVSEASGIRLYPSPATDVLNLQWEKPAAENTVWEIFDLAGRLLQSGEFLAENPDFKINVAALPEGIYHLRLSAGQSVSTLRFLKN
ncbi:MAG: hypothetical protein OHK0019_38010 [Saprospiraceae bacterium]